MPPLDVDFVGSEIAFLYDIQNSLAFGNDTRRLLPPTGEQADLMFTSASCVNTPNGDYVQDEGCSTFYHGIMNNGLHVAFLGVVSLFSDGLVSVQSANSSSYDSLNTTLNGDIFTTLRTLQDNYLDKASAYNRLLSIEDVCCIFGFYVIYFIGY